MSGKENLVLVAVGPDRVGLVERISEFIFEYGCNIEDSKMAVFCGEFALILLLSGEEDSLPKVAEHYRELESRTGLNIWVKKPSDKKPAPSALFYRLKASCMDHPGVVYHLSGILRSVGINIESMETKTYAAPVSGTPIFRLEAQITIPTDASITAIRTELQEFAQQENIDIELSSET
ncbi:MAG: glycine cleavage system protein R [Deltaproteobacteria bacterium]|nr:glycine cleavage system protein R [Deltaproteobacteria bacterium]